MSTQGVAQKILEAYKTGIPIDPIRSEITGVSAAYDVQRATVEIWKRLGRKVAGQKIGLTSKAIQTQLGVAEPDFGTLFSDMILEDGSTIALSKVMQPRIEAEIAFVLKTDLRGDQITPEAVIAATDYICPAIEICGSRIAGWDIRIEDTIADNASSALVVVGKRHTKPVLADLAMAAMTLQHNGEPAGEARGEACLGNPANAVAWLGTALNRLRGGLRAGDLVMSGGLSKMVAANAGSRFHADFGPLGTVSVEFSR